MPQYFDDCESAQFAFGSRIHPVLNAVANKYVSANPVQPFVFRLSSAKGFIRNRFYRYIMDFDGVYPGTENEKTAFAWAKLWSDADKKERFRACPYSPMDVWVNGEQVFHSNFSEEKNKNSDRRVEAQLKKGWNSFFLSFVKTSLGFGGEFGTASFKGKPLHFLAPTPERAGQEGFVFTRPMDSAIEIPQLSQKESELSTQWYPAIEYDDAKKAQSQLRRLFGLKKGCYAYGWAKVLLTGKAGSRYTLKGRSESPLSVYVDGKRVFGAASAGNFDAEFTAKSGLADVLVESLCGGRGWGYELSLSLSGKQLPLLSPCNVKGTGEAWIYAGAFSKKQEPAAMTAMSAVFDTAGGQDYWHVDMPDMYVRPFLETVNYANWNYPLGVTLYGLLEASKVLGRPELADYVQKHVGQCTSFYEYALWDRKKYGAAGIDAQISAVDSLDDCGSFASTMLETSPDGSLSGCRKVADDVADYISSKQARLPDGSLYRFKSSLPEMFNTIWLDDLYMSVPFLTRYYRLTGDKRYLDDAAKQFLLYKEKMFIPQLKVMSHVYYTDRKLATGIPWGRGNGWVLFSLSELLRVLPEDHEKRQELLAFYRELCEGYAAFQDKDGMWHQVLNDWESYPESSCTSMFICGFARGVRYGWLKDPDKYRDAAIRGWEGLTRVSVDRYGNIYGICRGSGHSFSPRYYKYDLGWILNDTHGIGILLLAGTETEQMLKYLEG